jgi:hypothetical protein
VFEFASWTSARIVKAVLVWAWIDGKELEEIAKTGIAIKNNLVIGD